ncbi:hypothetical protein [Burkholderia gladioli]|uniref:hypothetical protein n=1 Tax=Burkholderia gladioli TaxID=28095 RepID=UPI00163E35F0|nr:hypothetical protein [Burkholderia gladioli]
MHFFIVRVVLHNIQDKRHASYTKLHTDMEAAGFARHITDTNNITYHLPPAEYLFYGDFTSGQVRDKARAIANRVDSDNGVLVAKALPEDVAWVGLKTV